MTMIIIVILKKTVPTALFQIYPTRPHRASYYNKNDLKDWESTEINELIHCELDLMRIGGNRNYSIHQNNPLH